MSICCRSSAGFVIRRRIPQLIAAGTIGLILTACTSTSHGTTPDATKPVPASAAVDLEPLAFESSGHQLSATLAVPRHQSGPFPLVVFIHGDGASDADRDGGYLPIRKALAAAGAASLSWDKPGVADGEDDWLNQSMNDRALEATAAIAAVQQHPRLGAHLTDEVAAWGASQAGWVIPELARRQALSFAILWSPAINWSSQGRFQLDTRMQDEGLDPTIIEEVRPYYRRHKTLLQQGASHQQHLALQATLPRTVQPWLPRLSLERWTFATINHAADSTEALAALAGVPVMLQLGNDDVLVDIDETERVYRQQIDARCLRVRRYRDTDHSLIRSSLSDCRSCLIIEWLWDPRRVFGTGVLDDTTAFAADATCAKKPAR